MTARQIVYGLTRGSVLVLLLIMSGVLAQTMLPAVDPSDVSGDVITAGSSTVYPLSVRMVERFNNAGFTDDVMVESIGSGGGFERFCIEGDTDISNASRAIQPEEIDACLEIGRDPIEFRVGTDALAITVSASNNFVYNVTMDELRQIFSEAVLWSDVRAGWPDEPIYRFIPGTDSGTFDYFTEEVFDKDHKPVLTAFNLRASEDDRVLVQGVADSPYAVSFFGYAYYLNNQDALRVLNIGGVQPNERSAESGSYPLARPLFIYSAASIMQEKPQVAAFINYYLTHVNEEIIDVGYFPASEASLDVAREMWLEATGN